MMHLGTSSSMYVDSIDPLKPAYLYIFFQIEYRLGSLEATFAQQRKAIKSRLARLWGGAMGMNQPGQAPPG